MIFNSREMVQQGTVAAVIKKGVIYIMMKWLTCFKISKYTNSLLTIFVRIKKEDKYVCT